MGVNSGIVDKSGTWFSYGDIRLGQGRENARIFLREHDEVAKQIEAQVRQALHTKAYTDCEEPTEENRKDGGSKRKNIFPKNAKKPIMENKKNRP